MPEKKQEKPKFPVVHKKCPGCGSEKRMAAEAMKEENPDIKGQAALELKSVALTNTVGAIIKSVVPILAVMIDACDVCGCLYVIEARKGLGSGQLPGANFGPGATGSGLPGPGPRPFIGQG